MITHAGCWENTRKAVRYYIETSVLLEDIPLVKFIKNYIWDPSGLFPCLSMTQIITFIYRLEGRGEGEDFSGDHLILGRKKGDQ